jgi:hypothetical protein
MEVGRADAGAHLDAVCKHDVHVHLVEYPPRILLAFRHDPAGMRVVIDGFGARDFPGEIGSISGGVRQAVVSYATRGAEPRSSLKAKPMTYRRIAFVLSAMVMALMAQRFLSEREEEPRPAFPQGAEFHFLRLEYTDLPQYHRRRGFASRSAMGEGWWMVDWPDADDHFSSGVERLTRVQTGDPRHVRLTDERIFDYPWIYATQAGWWALTDSETKRLGEYLARGGYLVVDDFWGAEQWAVFRETMARALPGHLISDVVPEDSVMHVLYDIEEKDRTFIPGTRHLRRGPSGGTVIQQPPGAEPTWRALYDDRNRMVVAVNFNTDLGDAWEYADSPEYPAEMTSLAYRYGINYLIYAMTH